MKERLLYRYARLSVLCLLLWLVLRPIVADATARAFNDPPFTVTLSNSYRITLRGVTNQLNNTSTWGYTVEALPGAKKLQKWVLALPPCATMVAATPEPWDAVRPDSNTGLDGVRWQKFGRNFQQGDFSVTLTGPVVIGVVRVAAKAAATAYGLLAGPVCDPSSPAPTAPASPTATPSIIPTAPTATAPATFTATLTPTPTIMPPATAAPTNTAAPATPATSTPEATATATVTPQPTATPTASPTPPSGAQPLQVSKTDYLGIDADEDGFVSAGDTLLYAITVVNHSNRAVTAIRLRDTLSPMTTLLPGTLQTSQGATVVDKETTAHEIVVEMASLARDTTATISFQVRLAPSLTGGQLANQAVVTFGNPAGQGGEGLSIVSDDPDTTAALDPTLTPLQGGAQLIYLPLAAR